MADEKNTYSWEELLVNAWHKINVLSLCIFGVFAVLYTIALAGSTYEIFPVAEGVFRAFYKGIILSGMAWFFLLTVSEMLVSRLIPIGSRTDVALRRQIANLEKGLAEAKDKIADLEARVAELEEQ